MAKRILLAGVLGGFAFFVWGGLSHMVLGLGEVGVQNLPQPQPVMDALKASVAQPGFYFFPEVDKSGQVAADKVGGPYGIMIYQSAGAGGSMTGQLINECILNIVVAMCAAFLLAQASRLTGYLARVGFVTILGLIAGGLTNLQYWNWYRFPANYTLASMLIAVVGFVIVGVISAAIVRPSEASVVSMPARAA